MWITSCAPAIPPRYTSRGDLVLNQKLWQALLHFIDPKVGKGPLIEPGRDFYRVNRKTLDFEKMDLTDGMHPFSMDKPVGQYVYRLWIKKPGQEEKELGQSHTITGKKAFLEIWDEKKTDNMLMAEVWNKLYRPLLPRLKPNGSKRLKDVIWGFAEY